LLEEDPDEPAHYVKLALLCHEAGEIEEAAASLELALGKGSPSWSTHVLLGGLYMEGSQPALAVQHYLRGRALAPSPTNIEAVIHDFFPDPNVPIRLTALADAATDPGPEKLDPDDYADLVDPDFATAESERELAARPDYAECCYYVASVHEMRGELAKAVERLRATLARNPDFLMGSIYLSALLAKSGETAEAATLLAALALEYPDFADVHVRLGNLHLAAGRDAEARAAYGRAKAINPDFDPPDAPGG
ncbi:MAG: tetratricopeptide repeat protein, partial [Planctomycetota bacterium]